MAMHSKQTGAYAQRSTEWNENAEAIYRVLIEHMTKEAAIGVIGNMNGESGLNPWRWQGDVIRSSTVRNYPSIGYGLVQYTPAEKYFNGADAWGTANFSDRAGSQNDWQKQMDFFFSSIQDQWNTTTGRHITWAQYCTLTDIDTAVHDFLYQFEQPADPAGTFEERRMAAHVVADVLKNLTAEYTWPLPGYDNITTHFGEPDAYYGRPHRGMDIAAPENTPIRSVADGTVVRSALDNSWGYFIVIKHSNNLYTLYAHMKNLSPLHVGDSVKQGQVIGYVGNTGDSLGFHLHIEFSVSSNLSYENLRDPEDYINPDNKPLPPGPTPDPGPTPTWSSGIAPIICELRRRKILL